MRRENRSLISIAILLAAAWTATAQGIPLRDHEVASLARIGLPIDEIADLIGARGAAFRWNDAFSALLDRYGVSPNDRRRLEGLASSSNTVAGVRAVADPRLGLSLLLPLDWVWLPTATGLRLLPREPRVGVEIEMDVAALRLPDGVFAKGVDLADLMDRRIEEIRTDSRTPLELTHRGTLRSGGRTGSHAVLESPTDAEERQIRSLTWFARGEFVLSFAASLRAPMGHPAIDSYVDDLTLILSAHAEGIHDAADLELLRRESETDRLLLQDGRGGAAAVTFDHISAAPLVATGAMANSTMDKEGGRIYSPKGEAIEARPAAVEGAAGTSLGKASGTIAALDVDRRRENLVAWTGSRERHFAVEHLDLTTGERSEVMGDLPFLLPGVECGWGSTLIGVVADGDEGVAVRRIALRDGYHEPSAAKALATLARSPAGLLAFTADDDGVILAFREEETVEIVGIDLAGSRILELAHLPLPSGTTAPRLGIAPSGQEILILLPGVGLRLLPRRGGLPLLVGRTESIAAFDCF